VVEPRWRAVVAGRWLIRAAAAAGICDGKKYLTSATGRGAGRRRVWTYEMDPRRRKYSVEWYNIERGIRFCCLLQRITWYCCVLVFRATFGGVRGGCPRQYYFYTADPWPLALSTAIRNSEPGGGDGTCSTTCTYRVGV